MISKLVTYLYNIVIHNVKQIKAKLTQVRFDSRLLLLKFYRLLCKGSNSTPFLLHKTVSGK